MMANKSDLKNKIVNIVNILLFIILIESAILGYHGYKIYKKSKEPDYLIVMKKDVWLMLDKVTIQSVVTSLYELSKKTNPDWGDNRTMWVYTGDKGLLKIFFVHGSAVPIPKVNNTSEATEDI